MTERTISIFSSILTPIVQSLKEDDELEVKFRPRFRGYENSRFIPSVGASIFFDLLSKFKDGLYDTEEIDPEHTIQTLIITRDPKLSSLRLSESFGDKDDVEFIRKIRKDIPQLKTIKGVDRGIFPQGFRISLASEIVATSTERKVFDRYTATTAVDNPTKVFTREKYRNSFIEKCGDKNALRFDFTKVNVGDEVKFEIEIEVVSNRNESRARGILSAETVAKLLSTRMIWLLQQIQSSDKIVTLQQHNNVFIEYVKLVGLYDGREEYGDYWKRDVFIGCQPESLHFRDIKKLYDGDYLIMDKSDGERGLMLFLGENVYRVDRYVHISKTKFIKKPRSSPNPIEGTLFDGEWFPDQNLFVVFDVLYCQSKDLRTRDTLERLEFGEKVISNITKEYTLAPGETNPITFKIKECVRWEPKSLLPPSAIEDVLSKDYHIDGIIFTPNEPCPRTKKWPKLLKWKSKARNSIDLYVENYHSHGNVVEGVYSLMIQTNLVYYESKYYILFRNVKSKNLKHRIHWIMDFKGNLVEIDRNAIVGKFRVLHNVCIPFPFQPVLRLSDCHCEFKELSPYNVYEFVFDYETRQLTPVLLRKDKTAKKYLGSNHLTVAVDIWDSMQHPIEESTFKGLYEAKSIDSLLSKFHGIGYNRPQHLLETISKEFDIASLEGVLLSPDEVVLSPVNSQSRGRGSRTRGVSSDRTSSSDNTKSSPIWRMRKFHNYIKRKLIDEHTSTNNRLLVSNVVNYLGGVPQKACKAFGDAYQDDEHIVFNNNEITQNHLYTFLGIDRTETRYHDNNKNKLCLPRSRIDKLLHQRYEDGIAPNRIFSVLDLCSGKGGDLWKYASNPIDYLVCVDDEKYLLSEAPDCALNRWKQVTSTSRDRNPTKAVFYHADARQSTLELLQSDNIQTDFDVVSCFFALHYLFESQSSLSNFLKNISEALTYNGYFIGVLVDGEYVYNEMMSPKKFKSTVPKEDKVLYEVTPVSSVISTSAFGNLNTYGNEINVYLGDSIIEEYIQRKPEQKKEYLVNFDKFVKIASHYGLSLVESVSFSEYYPSYHGARLSNAEQRFSFINRTFVFRKTTNSLFHSNVNKGLVPPMNFETFNANFEGLQKTQLESLTLIDKSSGWGPVKVDKDMRTTIPIGETKSLTDMFDESLSKTREREESLDPRESPKKKVKVASKSLPTPQPLKKKRKDDTVYCGKRCKKCIKCVCVQSKQKCVENICGCGEYCTNK